MSLLETMVAMTLAVVVMGTVISTFISFSNSERRQGNAIEQRQDMRRALNEISRMVRSGSPLWPAPDTASERTELTFGVPDDGSGATTRRLRLDAGRHEVVLETLGDPTTRSVIGQRLVLDGAEAPSTAFIRYFTLANTELIAGQLDPATMATCTVRLRITLGRSSAGGAAPLDMSTDVALRNRAPEAAAC